MLVPLDLLHTNDHPPAALEILQQLGRVSDVKFGHALHGCYISLLILGCYGYELLLNLNSYFMKHILPYTFFPPQNRGLLSMLPSLNYTLVD